MTDLFPTTTRLALLRDIQAGNVAEDWDDDRAYDAWLGRWPRRTKVTSRVAECKQAGWCETDPADDDLHTRGIRLTEAGVAVLDTHPQEDR